MIFEGLFVAATMGTMAYMSAKTEKSRNGFVDWVFESAFLIVPVIAISLLVDLGPVFQTPSDFPIAISLALVALFGLSILGRQTGRRLKSLNFSPLRLGLLFFVGTYVLFNIASLYFYLKEPS